MEYIKINNLHFNKYTLSGVILEGATYGIIGKDDDVTSLLKILAGINTNNDSCTHNGTNIFDEYDFFKNRLFIDLSQQIVCTTNAEMIKNDLNIRYGVSFDVKKYKNAMNETNARSEINVTSEYEFSNAGINKTAYAVLCGLNYPYLFVDNPFNYIKKEEHLIIDKMVNNIIDRANHKVVVINANDISNLVKYLDFLIILGDYENVYIIRPNSDKFIITDDYVGLNNRIFRKDNVVIIKAPDEKEEYKELKRIVRRYKEVDFMEAYSYYIGKEK